MVIHDPELLLALPSRRRRPPAAVAVHTAERMAERYVHLILAERGYFTRFGRPHPVVPNTTYVPDIPAPSDDGRRVVYVGHLSPDRGTAEMIELARRLRPHGVTVELIGPADPRARAQIAPAQAAGLLRWHGFVPNDQTMPMLDGALAGLSLLRDEPNFRLDAHQGGGVHGPRRAGGDHPAARRGRARPRARMRVRGAVRRPGHGGGRGARTGPGFPAAGEDGAPRT
jgi:glycosyltransferase involved in cell wall biosynthesis